MEGRRGPCNCFDGWVVGPRIPAATLTTEEELYSLGRKASFELALSGAAVGTVARILTLIVS